VYNPSEFTGDDGKWVGNTSVGHKNYDNDVVQTSVFSNAGNTDTDTLLRQKHDLVPDGSYIDDFNRWYSIYPTLEMDGYCQYVFFVRPDCNIINVTNRTTSCYCSRDPFFIEMLNDHMEIMVYLKREAAPSHLFIPFLTSRIESLQIPDISIKNYSISQPFTNYLMPYGGNAIESMTGGTFDATFRDDRELNVHKFFQAWLTYISGVTRREYEPDEKYIRDNKFDYMSSVYYFICLPDATSIVWWSKYTGVFPINVPNSDLSFNLRGNIDNKCDITFAYFTHRVFDATTITDFNKNSPGDKYYVDPYTESIVGSGNAMAGAPYIERNADDEYYKLRWRVCQHKHW
jgi:hypothetical protein